MDVQAAGTPPLNRWNRVALQTVNAQGQTAPAEGRSPLELQRLEQHLEQRSKWMRLVGTDQPQTPPAEQVAELPPLNRMSDRERWSFDYKDASELTDTQWQQYFGGDWWKLKDLAVKRGMKVGDIVGLAGDPDGADAVRSMMEERPDLQMSDLTKKRRDGTVMIDPAIQQPESRDTLTKRHDIKPIELTQMGASFASWLRNPALAKEAYVSALDLLKTRSNVRPKELEQMMGSMIQSVGGNGKAQSPKGGAAVVDMFKSGVSLLKKRADIQPHDVARMAKETGKLAGKDAGDEGPGLVAQAFKTATKALERAPHLQVDDVNAASKTMRKHFPGEDAKATQDRVRAFETGINLMAEHPGLKAGHLDQMLTKAKEQQPGMGGVKLLNAFEGMGKGVANGTVNLDAITDPKAGKGKAGGVKIDKFGQVQANDQVGGGHAVRPPAGQRREGGRVREKGPREGRQEIRSQENPRTPRQGPPTS